MMEPTVTAEDLTLYALHLLEGDERGHVEAMLAKSTAAREELANIQGDLALFAMASEQHTPQTLTRQRLLQQVARERRTVPVQLPIEDGRTSDASSVHRMADRDDAARLAGEMLQTAPVEPNGAAPRDPESQPTRTGKATPERTFPSRLQQRVAAAQGVSLPRVVQEPSSLSQESHAAADAAGIPGDTDPSVSFTADRKTFSPDPQVYPREARSLSTSAPAHSVTMFEQHFASEGVSHADLDPAADLDMNTGRRHRAMDTAVEDVQDRFVPSAGRPDRREDGFALSSYRGDEASPSQPNALGRWVGWSGWAAAAAMAAVALVSMRDDFSLREQASRQQTQMAAVQANALKAQMVLQTLESPVTQNFLLARTDAAPAPGGRVAYLPEHGTLVFQGSNLETLQPYKTYELWLIPSGEGRQPVPAGLFKPDGHGYATVVLPQMTKGLVAGNFGVTIEDEGGSATPTLPILLVGQQS